MATSPIYNWPEPDNTDLVKNGALAMRTLGDAIDTTMATMTPKSIVDAKGDLIAASAADTPARLAVGNNGETLVADSSTATGLRYQGSMAAGRNFVTNGGMDIWQRGTSALDGQNTYKTADRWLLSSATAVTFSRQATGDTTNLPFIQYCMRVQRTSGSTSTSGGNISQSLETVNSIPLAGKTVTLSFYARKGADYSATSSVLRATMYTGTGTDQNVYTAGYTGSVTAIDQNATLTTTWQRFSFTATLAGNTTEIGTTFIGAYTGTASTNDYYEITGIQLEVGSVATQFTRQGGTIQGELAACLRYAWVLQSNFDCFYGMDFGGGAGRIGFKHPVTMRTAASYSLMSGTPQVRLASLATVNATPSLTTGNGDITALQFAYTGGIVGTPISYVSNSSLILLSAEL